MKFFFWKKTQNLKSLWSKGLTKKIWVESETKFFFRFKGGTLWCFSDLGSLNAQAVIDFDRQNGRSDILDCWNSGTKGCLNIKNLICEQVFDGGMTFHWVIWLKSRAGHLPPVDNVIPDPRWNRVNQTYTINTVIRVDLQWECALTLKNTWPAH